MWSCLSHTAGIRKRSRRDHATPTALMESTQNNSRDGLAAPRACTIEKPSFMLCLVTYFDRHRVLEPGVIVLRRQGSSSSGAANKPSALTLKICQLLDMTNFKKTMKSKSLLS